MATSTGATTRSTRHSASISLPRPGSGACNRAVCRVSLRGGGVRSPSRPAGVRRRADPVPRAAAVESKRELVEVVVELVLADGALVGREDPTLDQRADEGMYCRISAGQGVGDE